MILPLQVHTRFGGTTREIKSFIFSSVYAALVIPICIPTDIPLDPLSNFKAEDNNNTLRMINSN